MASRWPPSKSSWMLHVSRAEKSSSAGHRPPTAAFPDEPLRPKAGAAAMGVAALLVAGYLLLGKRHVSSSWHTSHVFPRVGGVTGTSYQREGGHDPGGFALCRQLIGALLMAALGYCREGSSIFALRRSDHRAIAKLGAPSARSACRRAATREAARACTGPRPAPRCRRVDLVQIFSNLIFAAARICSFNNEKYLHTFTT